MFMYYIDYDNLPPSSRFIRLHKSGLSYFHNPVIVHGDGRKIEPLMKVVEKLRGGSVELLVILLTPLSQGLWVNKALFIHKCKVLRIMSNIQHMFILALLGYMFSRPPLYVVAAFTNT